MFQAEKDHISCKLSFRLHPVGPFPVQEQVFKKMASDVLTLENPVFAFYAICSAIILIKTICMSIYIGYYRVSTKVRGIYVNDTRLLVCWVVQTICMHGNLGISNNSFVNACNSNYTFVSAYTFWN